MNNGVEYKVLLDMNTAVQKIVFAISLSRNGYTIEQIDNITRNYDFANDLFEGNGKEIHKNGVHVEASNASDYVKGIR